LFTEPFILILVLKPKNLKDLKYDYVSNYNPEDDKFMQRFDQEGTLPSTEEELPHFSYYQIYLVPLDEIILTRKRIKIGI
jgi:hypothetical protein